MNHFLACDLGAESGRVMLGTLDSGRIAIEELHRFPNQPVSLPNGLYWDMLGLYRQILHGLEIAGRDRALTIDGVGVDSWGVDFGLLGRDGALVENPRHYRDPRNRGMLEEISRVVPRAEIFDATGIQFMPINSLCQWYALKLAQAAALECASALLFIPDLLNYWLSGQVRAEVTIASTSQFYGAASRSWSRDLLEKLGLNNALLPEIVEPGTSLGLLRPEVRESTGLASTPLFATAGHDTAAAVVAVPSEGSDSCYISSGTWSLMGVEIDRPVLGERCLSLNFTNEAGVNGTTRLLKNIAGLWLVQECRRAWALAGQNYTYEELTRMAGEAAAYGHFIDPDAFSEPGHMPDQIASHCRSKGLPVPASPAGIVRAILEGLALRYNQVLENLQELTGQPIRVIHIVGGGSRNRLLNQLAADATGRTVLAGPVEATALGNVLVQAMGAGLIGSLVECRAIVRAAFPPEVYEPRSKLV